MKNKIETMSEVLYRQVHPQFYEGGRLGSRAFKPNSGDGGWLSADRSSMVTAEASFEHYTKEMKKNSACVYGVTVEEFLAEQIDCVEDPLPAMGGVKANPAHCLADYNGHTEKEWKNIAQRIKANAEKRGRQYLPPKTSLDPGDI